MPSIKNRIALAGMASGLLLAGCSSAPAPEQKTVNTKAPDNNALKQYPMRGKITALDATRRIATIDHGDVPGFMGAMTMGYIVKDPNEFGKLMVGDPISATVYVQGDVTWIGDVKPDTGPR